MKQDPMFVKGYEAGVTAVLDGMEKELAGAGRWQTLSIKSVRVWIEASRANLAKEVAEAS